MIYSTSSASITSETNGLRGDSSRGGGGCSIAVILKTVACIKASDAGSMRGAELFVMVSFGGKNGREIWTQLGLPD